MPIRIVEPPDPLTTAARQAGAPILIGSEALRLLRRELNRYCYQMVSGRSFLIAGHRGAGKTTLVQGAFHHELGVIQQDEEQTTTLRLGEEVRVLREEQERRLRPLLVLLQGPNLLPPTSPSKPPEPPPPAAVNPQIALVVKVEGATQGGQKSEEVKAPEPAKAPEAGVKEAPKADPVAKTPDQNECSPSESARQIETVLIQITLALYRALADEFARCYALRVPEYVRLTGSRGFAAGQLLELAAKFELDLDQYPGTQRLREYWRLVDALETGVLFPVAANGSRPADQGLRELVALSSACEAYQRICGTVSRTDQMTSGANQTTQASAGVDTKASELLKPLTALLAGGAVSTGVLAAHQETPVAVLAGLVTALGSSLVFKYSKSRTSQRAMNRADLFIPDLSVATLDRVLPVLLNRIRRAGLAPVFVVDELDKIDLSERITEMVKRLKKLVAENAFFCFLTDRKYFEEMTLRTADAPYPIEYTYFTNQLFIIFRHDDLHAYLSSVLRVGPASPQEPLAPAQPPDPQLAEDEVDREILPYVLMHSAQMHPIDLRRQLLSIQDEEGRVKLARGAVRSRPRHRYEVMIQVAVEMALADSDMQSEIEIRPAFLQMAHDALYFISRRWNKAPKRLHLDDACKARFAGYLKNRMATDTTIDHQPQLEEEHEHSDAQAADDSEEAQSDFRIETATIDFLLEKVRDIAKLLANPSDLLAQASIKKQFSQKVLDAVSTDPLLKSVPDEDHVYDWCAFPSSRVIQRAAAPLRVAPPAAKLGNWEQDRDFVNAFQKSLSNLTGNAIDPAALASQYGVVKTSPAWDDVKRALDRLKRFRDSGHPYPEFDDDRIVLHGFCTLLEESARTIALALVSGLAIASLTPRTGPRSPLAPALRVISTGLRFLEIPPDQVHVKIRHLYGEILKLDSSSAPGRTTSREPPGLDDVEAIARWEKWVLEASGALDATLRITDQQVESFKASAWTYWNERFLGPPDVAPKDPGIDAIYCRATQTGPGKYLSFTVERMGVADWSRALVDAAEMPEDTPPSRSAPRNEPQKGVPTWLALVALNRLGFDDETVNGIRLVASSFDPSIKNIGFSGRPRTRSVPNPSGVVVHKGPRTIANWLPSVPYPLIVVDSARARTLTQSLRRLGCAPLLAAAFVAFEIQDEEPGSASSSAAKREILESQDSEILDVLAISTAKPIPIIFSHPGRIRSLGPRYLSISPQSPRDLFASVSSAGGQGTGGSMAPVA